jgi:hypothetical protein
MATDEAEINFREQIPSHRCRLASLPLRSNLLSTNTKTRNGTIQPCADAFISQPHRLS